MKPPVKEITVALVGNPNSGKTTIFNAMTGARQKVANWSGVTVEKREGHLRRDGLSIRITDLPGTYSLSAYSMEELIARNYILEAKPDVIVNIADAGNLDRNLYLTMQLINMGAPAVLVLNMMDEAEAAGLKIDTDRLGTLLGMPVVRTVGKKGQGVDELVDAVVRTAGEQRTAQRRVNVNFGAQIEREIGKIEEGIRAAAGEGSGYSTRWLALRLLEGDSDVEERMKDSPGFRQIAERAARSRAVLENEYREDIITVLSDQVYGFIAGALKECVSKSPPSRIDLSERIDLVLTNRYLGIPLLFLFLWLLFQATYTLGEYPRRLIEHGVAALAAGLDGLLPPGFFKNMLIRGVIGGVGGVFVFLPNILILFMGISFLEDTGYMARAAFIMDRVMHKLGLHGKSFIPLIMGFGCNVPAIMAARSLENPQDRILTILINPFMSCSARLPVYVLFAGIFFREKAGLVILSLYLFGLFIAFASARLFKHLFFRGESTPFVMELPPYRMPTGRSVLLHMWDRASQYVKKMSGVILVFSVLIWVLGEYPSSPGVSASYEARLDSLRSGYAERIAGARESGDAGAAAALRKRYAREREILVHERNREIKKNTVIGHFGDMVYPVLRPLGFNWQMGISLATGFVAKEVVVSTMGVLYHAQDEGEASSKQAPLQEILARPESGITPLAAYTFMLFVLLYVPCLATVVVIGREAGWGWSAFSALYTIGAAWLICFLFYNAGRLLGL